MERPVVSAFRRASGAPRSDHANGGFSAECTATAPSARWSPRPARHGIVATAAVCLVRLGELVRRGSFARILGSRWIGSSFKRVNLTLMAFVCVTLVAVPVQRPGAASSDAASVVSSSPGSAATSLANAPATLRAAVEKAIGSSHGIGTHAAGSHQALWDRSLRLGASFSLNWRAVHGIR